jgi:hypothetical protein
MPHPSHSPWFGHLNSMKLHMSFCPASCYFHPLSSKHPPQNSILDTLSVCSLRVRDQLSYLLKTRDKISTVFVFLALCLIQLWSCIGTDVKTVCKLL